MQFSEVSKYLERLEKTTSRNLMVEILSDLFQKVSSSEIDKIIYLMQGRVAPLFVSIEFGMADKMIIRAIAVGLGADKKEVERVFAKEGDLGITVEKLKTSHFAPSTSLRASRDKPRTVLVRDKQNLSISEVFDTLLNIARTCKEGSVEKKINLLAGLVKQLDPLSLRYVLRIPVAKLRLGFSDMTVLDSFSWMLKKDKSLRQEIERAYNVHPDLGLIGSTIKEKGILGLEHIKPEVFIPILMARAERLSSGEEIIKKIGKCSIEPKFDGFRLQAHFVKTKDQRLKTKDAVKLFTRNLEDATFMYPDLVSAIQKQIKADEAIFEGEAIAYNPDTNEFLPFQETVQRKRKYGIEEKAKEIPLKFILFDLLYINGENLIQTPYAERRKKLESMLIKDDVLLLSSQKIVDSAKQIELEFDDAVSAGLEGILAKKLDGVYRAGARDWSWIKFKRSYSGSLEDTIDALVLGYYLGQGKRTAFGIGAFLIGIYDSKRDLFVTVAKIGTGLTDEEWRSLAVRCNKLKAKEKPPLYKVDKMLEPDVWVEPEIVVEVRADEITRSPVHTAGRVLKPSKSGSAFDVDIPGFALRFPRLERFRDDRKPEDATSLSEIEEMFKNQRKEK